MNLKQYAAGLLIFLAIGGSIFAQDTFQGGKGADPGELATILKSPDQSIYNKTYACKMAALQGKANVVPVLAKYLGDPKMSHPARIALRQIPGPEAGKALCESLKTVKDLQLIPGILRTIGERKEASSVSAVTPFLSNSNRSIFSAAVFALGKITGKEAADALEKAWGKADPSQKTILVSGLTACAVKADLNDAKRIFSAIKNDKDLHSRQRSIGIQRLFLLSGEAEREKILAEVFRSSDKYLFQTGLQLAGYISKEKISDILTTGFDKYDNAQKILILTTLQNYKCKKSADFSYKIATTPGDIDLRIAALRTLGKVGDVTYADGLFKSAAVAAQSKIPWDVVVQHLVCLGKIDDPKLDDVVVKMLEKKEGFLRSFMLNLAADRRLRASLPIFLEEISKSKDKWDRIAAVSGCVNTMNTTEIPKLLALIKDKPKENQESIREVILRLVHDTNNREQAAQVLEEVIPTADKENKTVLYRALTYTRSAIALKLFRDVIIKGTDVDLQDEVLKALGEWPEYNAAPVLLEAAKVIKIDRLQIRAVRAYIRIIRQMQLGGEHRVLLAQTILPYIKRAEEMQLLLAAIGRSDSKKALAFVKPYLDKPEFKETVCISMFEICKQLNISEPEVIETLKHVEKITTNKKLKEEINDLIKGLVVQRH